MRLSVLLLFVFSACLLAASLQAFAQENQAESKRTFLVTIVEARFVEQDKTSEANAEMLWAALRDSSKTVWMETVQCTVLDGQKSRVMFGRQVPVVMGITESAHGKTRNMVDKPLGTGVSLSVRVANDKVGLEIEYQSSRLSGENTGELPPPEVETNLCATSVVLDLDRPKLLASTPNSTILVVIQPDVK